MKYPDVTGGQTEAVINKLGGMEGLQRFLAGELVVSEKQKQVTVPVPANGGITYAGTLDTAKFLTDWQDFLLARYNVSFDGAQIALPPVTPGFGWGVVVVPQVTTQQVFERGGRDYDVDKYWGNLDEEITVNTRSYAQGLYIIWCRDRIEADEELKNLSARDLEARGINCMTAHERLLLEDWFYWKSSGGHLDVKNITLCAGSRSAHGRVPRVNWRDRVFVDFCDLDGASGYLRARQVVSLAAAPAAA